MIFIHALQDTLDTMAIEVANMEISSLYPVDMAP